MRLKIDGVWEDADIIERRAAEWVYNQIVSARRDPALLTLEDPENGFLRVFPVSQNLPREVELTLIQPAGMNLPIQIGETFFEVPGEGVAGFVFGGGVVYPRMPKSFLGKPSRTCWIVDRSKKGVAPDGYVPHAYHMDGSDERDLYIVANLETRSGTDSTADENPPKLPNRFELDAARTIRQAAHMIRGRNMDLIFVGPQWKEKLKTVKPLDHVGIASAVVFNSTNIVDKNNFLDSFEPFVFSNALDITYTGVPPVDAVMIPENTRWVRGAVAWRRYQDFYENQSDTQLWRELYHASARDNILLPLTSFIVVENEAQRKMLRVKQAEALNAHVAFDFDEKQPADAPTFFVLLGGLLLFLWLARRRRHAT
jgi:hypothetical protein